MKHTPAPWTFNWHTENIHADGVLIAHMSADASAEDAALIAAAPELLAALLEIKHGGFGKHAYAIASAAIAKAGVQL